MRVQSSDSVGRSLGHSHHTVVGAHEYLRSRRSWEFQCALMVPALLGLALIAAKPHQQRKMQHDHPVL